MHKVKFGPQQEPKTTFQIAFCEIIEGYFSLGNVCMNVIYATEKEDTKACAIINQ